MMTSTRAGWLMKNEPEEFSIDILNEKKIGRWDGIRNFQARNFIRDMKIGEKAFFYHSSCAEPGIYGMMTIASEAYPDPIALEKKSDYFDSKSTLENNRWSAIDVQFKIKYSKPLLLPQIRELPLGITPLTAKGNRLSLFPLTEEQFKILENELNRIQTLSDPNPEEQKSLEKSKSKKRKSNKN